VATTPQKTAFRLRRLTRRGGWVDGENLENEQGKSSNKNKISPLVKGFSQSFLQAGLPSARGAKKNRL
jgi:hypothetical protein